MRTKKLSIEFEEVKVAILVVDLKNLENYMSKFLALKNHQRHTDAILEVRGFDESNKVRVAILIQENEPEDKEMQMCVDFVEQFGEITHKHVENAWILNDDLHPQIDWLLNGMDGELDWYVYGHGC